MRVLGKLLAALLIIALHAADAQTKARSKRPKSASPSVASADPFALPVLSLKVEGNRAVSADAVIQFSGIKIGDIATKEFFDAARQKLLDSGFFDWIGYEYVPAAGSKPGYSAKFTVREVNPLYPVKFAGFSVKPEELEAYLRSRDPLYNGSAPPTQALMDRWAGFLSAWTASKNQPARIIGKLVSTGANDYIIQFQPDAPLPAVARVEFSGNQAIDTTTLQNSIGSVAYGLPYTEQNFTDLLNNQLRPLYEARGYLNVRFEHITTEPVPPPTKGLLVNVAIVEGPIYKLGKVSFAGIAADDNKSFLRLTALKGGETVNFDAVGQAVDKVKRAVRRSGYLQASVAVERKLDTSNKTVDITFKVERGDRYGFGILAIKGLDLTGEAAVRKLWGEKPGAPFNPDYPDYFLSQIKDAGLFDHLGPTKSEVKTTESTHTADVTLIFLPQEKKKKDEPRPRGSGYSGGLNRCQQTAPWRSRLILSVGQVLSRTYL